MKIFPNPTLASCACRGRCREYEHFSWCGADLGRNLVFQPRFRGIFFCRDASSSKCLRTPRICKHLSSCTAVCSLSAAARHWGCTVSSLRGAGPFDESEAPRAGCSGMVTGGACSPGLGPQRLACSRRRPIVGHGLGRQGKDANCGQRPGDAIRGPGARSAGRRDLSCPRVGLRFEAVTTPNPLVVR